MAMELWITMIPASEEPVDRSSVYQRQLGEFAKSLGKAGVEYTPYGIQLFSSAAPFIYDGEFVIKLLQTLGPAGLGGIVGAWLQARSGRKVRLKVGEIEAEARTAEEVEKLLKRAEEIQQRSQSKVIHEP